METNEPHDFVSFLESNQHRQATKKSLFGLRTRMYSLFRPQPDQSKMLLLEPRAKALQPIQSALEAAQTRFRDLPLGYRTFMSLLGPGVWANAILVHPDFLQPLMWPEKLATLFLSLVMSMGLVTAYCLTRGMLRVVKTYTSVAMIRTVTRRWQFRSKIGYIK